MDLDKIKKVFSNILGIDKNLVTELSTIENLKGWDSMKHLELVLAIEEEFSIEFLPHEIILLSSVESILLKIKEKRM